MTRLEDGPGDVDPELDALLQQVRTPVPPARLIGAILALQHKPTRAGFFGIPLWRPAALAFGAVLVGFFLGQTRALPRATDGANIDRLLSSLVLASDVDFSEFEK